MLDFVKVRCKINKDKSIDVFPDFVVSKRNSDLMIRGGAFYAVWIEDKKIWSKDEYDAIDLVDRDIWNKVEELKEKYGTDREFNVKLMKSFSSTKASEWKKYLKQCPDNFVDLDSHVMFSDQEIDKKDYASKRLPYSLSDGDCPNYDKLMDTLYSPKERDKIEWAIGSVFTGDAAKIQKFLVLYGEGGTGKSTVLNIIQQLFEGYFITFEAKAIVQNNNQFALEMFKNNPLVAIQHDGNLSKIEDNSKFNSLVAHEPIVINEKFKSQYEARFSAFLFMGTNKPVMITDAKSGLIRRLIDVRPTGKVLPYEDYICATRNIKFELGAIAKHCIDKYEKMGIDAYLKYKPTEMFSATNDMYNFVYDNYDIFADDEYTTLKRAWTMYKEYVEETKMQYSMNMRVFKTELMNYFERFDERVWFNDTGKRERNVFRGFRADKFTVQEDVIFEPSESEDEKPVELVSVTEEWLDFKFTKSRLDDIFADCSAQYAKEDGTPAGTWAKCKTKLKDLWIRVLSIMSNRLVLIILLPISIFVTLTVISAWRRTLRLLNNFRLRTESLVRAVAEFTCIIFTMAILMGCPGYLGTTSKSRCIRETRQ